MSVSDAFETVQQQYRPISPRVVWRSGRDLDRPSRRWATIGGPSGPWQHACRRLINRRWLFTLLTLEDERNPGEAPAEVYSEIKLRLLYGKIENYKTGTQYCKY